MRQHKNILITGASTGLGKAMAERFVSNGHNVVGTSRKASLDTKIASNGLTMLELDVCEDDSVEALLRKVEAEKFVPEILILNAGYGIFGAVEETSTAQVIAQFDTNFVGVHRLVKAFIPMFRTQGGGHIVIIGSMLSQLSIPFQSFYGATKAALACYASALRMELKPFGIDVTLIEPGDHNTDFPALREVQGAEEESPYFANMFQTLEYMAAGERNGASPTRFANQVVKILNKRQPKFRHFVIKPVERVVLLMNKFLPHKFVEYFVIKMLKLI